MEGVALPMTLRIITCRPLSTQVRGFILAAVQKSKTGLSMAPQNDLYGRFSNTVFKCGSKCGESKDRPWHDLFSIQNISITI